MLDVEKRMGRQAVSWTLFKREATAAAIYVFGDGSYDLGNSEDLWQLGAICLCIIVFFLALRWVSYATSTIFMH